MKTHCDVCHERIVYGHDCSCVRHLKSMHRQEDADFRREWFGELPKDPPF